jgi:polar amino acid transport system substrate-binding protein
MASHGSVLFVTAIAGSLLLGSCATKPQLSPAARAELAPGGKLRAGINYGNVVLATKDPASGELRGLHVDLARELARRADVAIDLIGYDTAGGMVDGLKRGALDVALLSAEPARAGEINFSPAYVDIDATYLVPAGSKIRDVADVDRDGTRVAIAAKSAYEFFLGRSLKHARLVPGPKNCRVRACLPGASWRSSRPSRARKAVMRPPATSGNSSRTQKRPVSLRAC